MVDDAASVAIMIPIALSVAKFAGDSYAKSSRISGISTPNLMTASCLGVLYGSAAGGMATPAGVPFNPLAISLLNELTGYHVSFAQWTLTGIILMIAIIPVYYLVLKYMSPPEVQSIAEGAEYFNEEKKNWPAEPGGKECSFCFDCNGGFVVFAGFC